MYEIRALKIWKAPKTGSNFANRLVEKCPKSELKLVMHPLFCAKLERVINIFLICTYIKWSSLAQNLGFQMSGFQICIWDLAFQGVQNLDLSGFQTFTVVPSYEFHNLFTLTNYK